MRKLMIAVVATALAVVSNAASVNWKTSYAIGNGTSDGLTAATMVYLIDASVLTQSSIYDSVSGGKTLDAAIGANAVASATLTNGEIAKQTLTIDSTGSKTYYMALFDSTVGANGSLYFSEQLTKTLLATGSANYSFESNSSIESVAANMTGFNASTGGWVSTSSIPEPTSAMLLMLGLCGLALKRKNA